MNHFSEIIKILFRTGCENSESKPHSDGVFVLRELSHYLQDCNIGIEVTIQEYEKECGGESYLHGNLIAKKTPLTGGAHVAFQGHIDTVPCVSGPYSYKVTDTEIVGRGAVDMKGPLSAAIMAFLDVAAEGIVNVALLVTDDEETDFSGVEKLLDKEGSLLPNIACCVNVEPTNNLPAFMTRGFAQYSISAQGHTAHSSSSKNDMLIEKMTPVIAAVSEYLEKVRGVVDPIYGATRAAFTMLNAGTKTNQLPSEMAIVCNMRTVTKDSFVYKNLFDLIVRPACEKTGMAISIEEMFFDPFDSLVGQEVKKNLAGVFCKLNIEYQESVMHAFAESYMLNREKIPCFSWGAGDMDNAHVLDADERIFIKDIELSAKMLALFARTLK